MTNHINQMYHYFRSYASSGDAYIFPIGTKVQIGDIFTKPLPTEQCLKLRLKLMGFWEVDGVLTNPKDFQIIVSNFASDKHYVKEGAWQFNGQPKFLCVNACAYVDMNVIVTFESFMSMMITFKIQGHMQTKNVCWRQRSLEASCKKFMHALRMCLMI